jgi:peptidoglycan L-alanyl-D-glutamate endopeptidase CwlK
MSAEEINRDIKLIHPELVKFYNSFSVELKTKHNKDFRIFEGHRTPERQKKLFRQGFSKTLNSKHLLKPSNAIDVIEFPWSWAGFIVSKEYLNFVTSFLSNEKFKNIEWGGSWKNFKDFPHFQIRS